MAIAIPKLDADPAYVQAVAKLTELGARGDAIRDEIAQLESELEQETHRLDEQAREFLATGTIAPRTVNTRERIDAARQSLQVVERAAALQREDIERVKRELGAKVRKQIQREYADLARRAAAALREYAQANQALKTVQADLQAGGMCGPELPPLAADWLDADETQGRLYGVLQPMKAAGFID